MGGGARRAARGDARRTAGGPRRTPVLARSSRRPRRRRRPVAHRQGGRGDDGDPACPRVRRRAGDLHRHCRRPVSRRSVGDVVVAKTLLQHDMDASPLFPRHEVPLYGTDRFHADEALSAALAEAARATLVNADAGTADLALDAAPICAPSASPRHGSTPAWWSAATPASFRHGLDHSSCKAGHRRLS